jgi:hypothetical protein
MLSLLAAAVVVVPHVLVLQCPYSRIRVSDGVLLRAQRGVARWAMLATMPAGHDGRDALDAQLRRIQEKLSRVPMHRVPGRSNFGAQAHRYQLGRRLDPEALRAPEAAGLILPRDFRRFVTELGNGGAGPAYGWERFDPARPEYLTAPPFERARCGEEDCADERATILLHEHGCGTYDFLVLRGDGVGQVWFSDDHCRARRYGMGFVDHYEAWLDWLLNPDAKEPCPE